MSKNNYREYIINPSALSYLCNHCAYLKQNFDLSNDTISAGITSTLDGIEKDYFLGDSKKIDENLDKGQTIDPYNVTFYSKILFDNKKRPFRIKGKGDAIVKFEDGSCGIIDYKTSKFKKNSSKKSDSFKDSDLEKKINEYNPQLHAYYLLYSNLETDFEFLKSIYISKYPKSKEPKITEGVNRTLNRIKEISVIQAKIFGLVFVYPEESVFENGISVRFSHQFKKVKIDMENFYKKITDYLDMLYKENPPKPPNECGCRMHKFFYNEEKLKELKKIWMKKKILSIF